MCIRFLSNNKKKLYGNSSLISVKSLGKDNPNTKNTNIHNKNEQIKLKNIIMIMKKKNKKKQMKKKKKKKKKKRTTMLFLIIVHL